MKTLMKLFGLGVLLFLDAKLFEKLGEIYRPTEDDFFDEDLDDYFEEDDDIFDDEYHPGYGDAVAAISSSDMFSSDKKKSN